jgi:hypothetical protein
MRSFKGLAFFTPAIPATIKLRPLLLGKKVHLLVRSDRYAPELPPWTPKKNPSGWPDDDPYHESPSRLSFHNTPARPDDELHLTHYTHAYHCLDTKTALGKNVAVPTHGKDLAHLLVIHHQ